MGAYREVVLGDGSAVWRRAVRHPGIAERFAHTLGHAQLERFAFTTQDRVWVLAYAREATANRSMLQTLAAAGVAEVVYVSSSSTIVAGRTDCWAYPRIKRQAEADAVALCHARVLTLGLVVEEEEELPGGACAATRVSALCSFMLAPHWGDTGMGPRDAHLVTRVDRPMRSAAEAWLYRSYGRLQDLCGSYPCLLRPLDILLRLAGIRWYGYTHLSNRLWTTTTS